MVLRVVLAPRPRAVPFQLHYKPSLNLIISSEYVVDMQFALMVIMRHFTMSYNVFVADCAIFRNEVKLLIISSLVPAYNLILKLFISLEYYVNKKKVNTFSWFNSLCLCTSTTPSTFSEIKRWCIFHSLHHSRNIWKNKLNPRGSKTQLCQQLATECCRKVTHDLYSNGILLIPWVLFNVVTKKSFNCRLCEIIELEKVYDKLWNCLLCNF